MLATAVKPPAPHHRVYNRAYRHILSGDAPRYVIHDWFRPKLSSITVSSNVGDLWAVVFCLAEESKACKLALCCL